MRSSKRMVMVNTLCYATYFFSLCKLLLSYRTKDNPISAYHGCDGFGTRHML